MTPPPDPLALAAADTLADALSDPHTVWPHPPADPLADVRRAHPQNLAGGAAGIALLHLERARTGHGDEATAHTWLKQAACAPVSAGRNADLFNGAPALGFVLACAAATTGGYRGALAALDEAIARLTTARLASAAARIEHGEPLPMHEFDLVHGLTGLGVYHLYRHPDHHLTHDVLAYLVRITESHHASDDRRCPGWWLAGGLNGQPSPDEFPDGHGNLGVAHGIAGPLALLSHAVLRGLPVPGATEAIGCLSDWLDQWRQPGPDGGAWWPGYLTLDNLRTGTIEPTQQPRPSWCYGLSGTARAQQLAGLALADITRQHHAETAMLTALRTADYRALEPDIGLCHGLAGMLQVAWRMAADADTPQLATELPLLAARLVARLAGPITNPELMDGAAGAALALHTQGTGTAPASRWDAFLLLS